MRARNLGGGWRSTKSFFKKLPTKGVKGTLYLDEQTGDLKTWDGDSYESVADSSKQTLAIATATPEEPISEVKQGDLIQINSEGKIIKTPNSFVLLNRSEFHYSHFNWGSKSCTVDGYLVAVYRFQDGISQSRVSIYNPNTLTSVYDVVWRTDTNVEIKSVFDTGLKTSTGNAILGFSWRDNNEMGQQKLGVIEVVKDGENVSLNVNSGAYDFGTSDWSGDYYNLGNGEGVFGYRSYLSDTNEREQYICKVNIAGGDINTLAIDTTDYIGIVRNQNINVHKIYKGSNGDIKVFLQLDNWNTNTYSINIYNFNSNLESLGNETLISDTNSMGTSRNWVTLDNDILYFRYYQNTPGGSKYYLGKYMNGELVNLMQFQDSNDIRLKYVGNNIILIVNYKEGVCTFNVDTLKMTNYEKIQESYMYEMNIQDGFYTYEYNSVAHLIRFIMGQDLKNSIGIAESVSSDGQVTSTLKGVVSNSKAGLAPGTVDNYGTAITSDTLLLIN